MNYAKLQRNLKVRKSKTGLGLFTHTPLKRGDFVIEYTGKLLTKERADEKGGRYLFDISNRRTIDGTNRKNMARYINHACRPNCEVDIRHGRIFVFACRKIKIGEELNYDYGKEYWDEYIKPRGCLCEKCLSRKRP